MSFCLVKKPIKTLSPLKDTVKSQVDLLSAMEKIYLPMVREDPQAFKSIEHLQGKLYHSERLCIEFIDHVMTDPQYSNSSEITLPIWSKGLGLVIIYVPESLGSKSRTEVEEIHGQYLSTSMESVLIPGDKIYFLREMEPDQIQFGYPMCDGLLKDKSFRFDYRLIKKRLMPCYFDSNIRLEVPIPIPQ